MRKRARQLFSLVLASILLAGSGAASVRAEELAPTARIVISELQTSGELTTDDFIELTNISDEAVDISSWTIETRSTSTTSQWTTRLKFAPNTVVYPGGSIIVSNQNYLSLRDVSVDFLAFNLAADNGHIRLLASDTAKAEDTLGWGDEATEGEGVAAPSPPKSESLQRKQLEGEYVDTDDNFSDFELGVPSPRAENIAPEEPDPDPETPPVIEEDPPVEETPVDGTPPETDEEAAPEDTPPIEPPLEPEVSEELGNKPTLLPPMISELFPDPGSPLTDANDEWVEIFNPNNEEISLKDHILQTGGTYPYSFKLDSVTIPALGYITIDSAVSNLVLSNSGGAARLVTPEKQFTSVVLYSEVETDQSYALDSSGIWEWTTTPTPDGVNVITKPVVAPPVIKAAAVKIAKATTPRAAGTKTTSVKATSTKKAAAAPKKKAASTTRTVFEEPAALPVDPPLHPAVLVAGGLLAVLYALYEYRDDLRSRIFQLRKYLESRRANRP